jgi:NAD(P)-dependent dehydrogenase (short-subunit alcohol dehydrogenase family)
MPLMPREGRVVFAALSARVGSITDNRLGGWYGYRASKAALNQFIRTLAIEWSRTAKGSVCVGLHPGTVDTALSAPFQANVAQDRLFTPQQSVAALDAVLTSLGAADTGQVYAWDGQPVPA